MARLSQYLEPKAPKATEIKSQTKLAWFSQYLDPKAPKTTEIKSQTNAEFIPSGYTSLYRPKVVRRMNICRQFSVNIFRARPNYWVVRAALHICARAQKDEKQGAENTHSSIIRLKH